MIKVLVIVDVNIIVFIIIEEFLNWFFLKRKEYIV